MLIENVPEVHSSLENDDVIFGTIDSWLIYKLNGTFQTDVTNASRTLLFDLHSLDWNAKLLKEFNVNSIVKMASSYKFCVIASGEYDIYAARERANEWDYAAGHAVAQNAGAIIKTLDEKPFLYGKEDYRNPSLLIKRAEKLDCLLYTSDAADE